VNAASVQRQVALAGIAVLGSIFFVVGVFIVPVFWPF